MPDLTQEEVLDIYRQEGAMWFFDYHGDLAAPHMELTSGLCTDGYINSRKVFSNPKHAGRIAFELAKRLWRLSVHPNWIVGSSYSGITFSYELAHQMGARHGFVEKDPQNPKRMIWRGLEIPAHASILQAEELITTFGTTLEVHRAVIEGNPEPVRFLPCVATAVYRPSKLGVSMPTAMTSTALVALVTRQIKTWMREECPLCENGSLAVKGRGILV